MTKRIGIYPGTFDPITKGHLHIIRRASKLVDVLIVSIANNASKKPMFDQQEREAMVKADIGTMHRINDCDIQVRSFDNLLMNYAHEVGATSVFRGLRAVSDFDYEFQMTGMNLHLAPDIETVFLMAAGMAIVSLLLSLLIPRHPAPGHETVFQGRLLAAAE